MEKRAPHCKLPVVKALVEAGRVRATVEVDLKLTVIDDVLIVSFKEL